MEDITFIPLQGNEFFNYDQLLDDFYKPFKPGTVQINHYFMVNHHLPTTMVTKLFFDDDDEQHSQFQSNMLRESRDAELLNRTPNVIPSSGIKPIKQVIIFWDSGRGSVPRYASRYISVRYVAYRAQCSHSLLYRKTVPTVHVVGPVQMIRIVYRPNK
jgi:hypothetical protein